MSNKPVVLTLGTFDGVHRGHQALLSVAERRARAINGEVFAVAFERPPRFLFSPFAFPYLLTTPEEKEELLRQFGADRVESIRFTRELSSFTEEEFFRKYLMRKWAAAEVVVGFNFRYGKDREGDVRSLAQQGRAEGLKVHSVKPVRDRLGVVSSGRIRPLVGGGRLPESRRLLGHAYTMNAPVIRGRGVGRRLGFPTANLSVDASKILPNGVFAVKAVLPTGVERCGLLNIGVRPTFRAHPPRRSVEVHLLDFSGDLTGRSLRLEFLKKIREETAFSSVKALVRQIGLDETAARRLPLKTWSTP